GEEPLVLGLDVLGMGHREERDVVTAGFLEGGNVQHVTLGAAAPVQELVDVQDPHDARAAASVSRGSIRAPKRPAPQAQTASAAKYSRITSWVITFETTDSRMNAPNVPANPAATACGRPGGARRSAVLARPIISSSIHRYAASPRNPVSTNERMKSLCGSLAWLVIALTAPRPIPVIGFPPSCRACLQYSTRQISELPAVPEARVSVPRSWNRADAEG